MTAMPEDPGVLMPLGSLVAIGTSEQGRAVLSTFGIAARDDLDAALSRTIEVLGGTSEGAELAACLTLVAEIAAEADSWFHVSASAQAVPPSVVLAAPGRSLACCLHGDVVECVAGGDDLLARVVGRAVEATGGQPLTVTAFDGGVCLASVRFAAGSMDAAARSAEDLARLTRARDVPEACNALRSVGRLSVRTP